MHANNERLATTLPSLTTRFPPAPRLRVYYARYLAAITNYSPITFSSSRLRSNIQVSPASDRGYGLDASNQVKIPLERVGRAQFSIQLG